MTEPRVIDFVHRIAVNAKLEPECLVAALVYLERMMKVRGPFLAGAHSQCLTAVHRFVLRGQIADPRFVLCHWNWRPVLLSVLLLGSKVWDDLRSVSAPLHRQHPTSLPSHYAFPLLTTA